MGSTNQASLLLAKQLKDLCKNPVDGFSAGLVDESNIFEWSVTIIGPPDTLYDGGFFNAIMSFPANYPNSPPAVRFTSEMWHPNVYPDGRVCISILHPPGEDPNGYELASERWSPVHTVESIVLSIISMLSSPNDESPANIEAAKDWTDSLHSCDSYRFLKPICLQKMARKFLVGGNWKCNGTTEEVKKIVTMLNEAEVPSEDVVEVVISPPFVFLTLVKSMLRPDFHVSAQNCWVRKGGAFTGEVSAEMLVNLGIHWVILGHSERRSLLTESNEFVGEKVAYALSQGLKVIACVGETLEQRESGSTMDVVAAQIKAISGRISNWANIVIAYEPVWAIGTGKVATPAQAQEVHYELRKWLHENVSSEVAATTRIIYGGSVNGANCKELAAKPDVDGFLVGGASLKPEIIDIIKSSTVKKSA